MEDTDLPTLWFGLTNEVRRRDKDRCRACGKLMNRWVFHHIKLRSQGGRDEVENLAQMHDACHRRAHQNPAWAKRKGLIA